MSRPATRPDADLLTGKGPVDEHWWPHNYAQTEAKLNRDLLANFLISQKVTTAKGLYEDWSDESSAMNRPIGPGTVSNVHLLTCKSLFCGDSLHCGVMLALMWGVFIKGKFRIHLIGCHWLPVGKIHSFPLVSRGLRGKPRELTLR